VVALEKKVRRLTQRGVSETDSSDNKLSRARLTLSERHRTHMYTSEGGGEARQIDITTGINYTAFILSFPLKDSSLLTRGGLVLKSKNVQLIVHC